VRTGAKLWNYGLNNGVKAGGLDNLWYKRKVYVKPGCEEMNCESSKMAYTEMQGSVVVFFLGGGSDLNRVMKGDGVELWYKGEWHSTVI
jgi:hypothetical protein